MNSQLKGTIGEEYVSTLAFDTFLSYWCYPNPHDELGDKKEICDLLILFKNTCIICQVKNYEFKGNHARYFRKTVESAAEQIQGAERKLFYIKNDLYIRHQDKGTIKFERSAYTHIIRLVIHLGEGLEYQHIGTLSTKTKQFIHILGREDFEYLLKELRTISDLTDYLNSRELLVNRIEKTALLGKEKDLLGLYLQIKSRFNEFIEEHKGYDLIIDLEDAWKDYEDKNLNSKYESDLLLAEKLIYTWVKQDLIKNEITRGAAEDLMSLNMNERRLFSISFIHFTKMYLGTNHQTIVRRHIVLNNIGFIFFYYPNNIEVERLKQLMFIAAEGFSLYTNYEVTKHIVIGISEGQNLSFTLADFSNYINFRTDELKQILSYLGWFQDGRMVQWNLDFTLKKCDD